MIPGQLPHDLADLFADNLGRLGGRGHSRYIDGQPPRQRIECTANGVDQILRQRGNVLRTVHGAFQLLGLQLGDGGLGRLHRRLRHAAGLLQLLILFVHRAVGQELNIPLDGIGKEEAPLADLLQLTVLRHLANAPSCDAQDAGQLCRAYLRFLGNDINSFRHGAPPSLRSPAGLTVCINCDMVSIVQNHIA